MLHILEHTLSHTIEDSVKLLPFLFFTYLLMELLEHTTGGKVQNKIKNAGKVGPLWGGLLGIMPQCGFSAAASSLYAGRVITVGTLLAVFLSTSDEMLPIFHFRGGRTGNDHKNSCSKSLHCDRFRISCRTGLCECFQKERKRHGHPCGMPGRALQL